MKHIFTINLMLLLVVIFLGLSLVSIRYQTRLAASILAKQQSIQDELVKEYSRLQLEHATYSSNLVLNNVAHKKLGLITPNPKNMVEVK